MVEPLGHELIRVLELAQGIAGPLCGMQLGDAGAEVVKVEPPEGDWSRSMGPPFKEGESALFLGLNRSKKSIALNLKTSEGQEIARRLITTADVIVQDTPATNSGIEFSYQEVLSLKKDVIVCSISPFGSKGSMGRKQGAELVIQGMAGMPFYLGGPEEPPVRIGADMASSATGLFAFQGVIAALLHRRKSGEAQQVEVSLLGSLINLLNCLVPAQFNPDSWDYSSQHLSGLTSPPDHGIATKDFPVLLGPSADQLEEWYEFCNSMGMDDLAEQSKAGKLQLGGYHAVMDHLKDRLEEAFKYRASSEILEKATSLGISAVPYLDYRHLVEHPQTQSMDMVADIEHPAAGSIRITGVPWKLQKSPAKIQNPPPLLGQDTRQVLVDLGFVSEEIVQLKERGVIGIK